MNKISNSTIILIVVMSLSLTVGTIGLIGMTDERDSKIKQLQNEVDDLNKTLQIMNVANQQYENDTASIIDAIGYAEKDNYTIEDRISPHCFFKITGKNSSEENCYGVNITDERISACMFQHSMLAYKLNKVPLNDTSNIKLCTEMIGAQS